MMLIVIFIYVITASSFEYDNTTPINCVKSKLYSSEKIEKLEDDILKENVSFRNFNINYRPRCIRKTFQGYYAVLAQENGSLCFVFWDSQNEIYSIYRTDKFISSDDFKQNIVIGETKVDSFISDGMNYFYFPISKMMMTGHICNDGVIVIQYDSSGVVEFVNYFSNEEIVESSDFLTSYIPYILPEDRTNQGTVL